MKSYFRRTWLDIDTDALRENYEQISSKLTSGARVMAVVKADAYGHGAEQVVKELCKCGCEWFAVSNLEEAMQVKSAAPDSSVLILGYTPPEYAERLAAHFGNDIDYIETSNEADLWPTNTMSVAEYVEYQKEGYEGVKRGCRDIRVLTSAWAAADSSNPMCRRKGYQEQVMEGAKGYYDVHPTHQHSGFGAYENDNLTKFFPMRERLGINVPWYANETALTGVNGAEDGVARNVWMKILWSWAHGSTDYIWYNLRATGWKPADPEQWYGLVTADYYPRAGFAAFSALAHVLSGLDFARIVHEGKGRHLFLFKGERGGVALQVLAGWDGFTDPPHPIPVKTDASRAFSIDLMGNIRPAEKRDGGFVFGISKISLRLAIIIIDLPIIPLCLLCKALCLTLIVSCLSHIVIALTRH